MTLRLENQNKPIFGVQAMSTISTRSHRNSSAMARKLRSLIFAIVNYAIHLACALLLVTAVLSWAISPDCPLEFNRTAHWTHQTLSDYFAPCLALIRPFLPDGGVIQSNNSPAVIDYTPGILATLLMTVGYGLRRWQRN